MTKTQHCKKALRITAILFLLHITPGNITTSFAQTPAPEPQFFSMLQDVPLMPGLEEIADQTVSFDKPEGRIIESEAQMHDLTKDQVLNFYQRTLPQFGWGKIVENRFFRNNEFLEIYFDENDGRNVVKIIIKPTL